MPSGDTASPVDGQLSASLGQWNGMVKATGLFILNSVYGLQVWIVGFSILEKMKPE